MHLFIKSTPKKKLSVCSTDPFAFHNIKRPILSSTWAVHQKRQAISNYLQKVIFVLYVFFFSVNCSQVTHAAAAPSVDASFIQLQTGGNVGWSTRWHQWEILNGLVEKTSLVHTSVCLPRTGELQTFSSLLDKWQSGLCGSHCSLLFTDPI